MSLKKMASGNRSLSTKSTEAEENTRVTRVTRGCEGALNLGGLGFEFRGFFFRGPSVQGLEFGLRARFCTLIFETGCRVRSIWGGGGFRWQDGQVKLCRHWFIT